MRKFLLVALLFVISCSSKVETQFDENRIVGKTPILKHVKTIKIHNTEISEITNLTFKDSNTVFTIDRNQDKIFEISLKDTFMVRQISKRGQGPGEYSAPGFLFYSDNQLFFNDFHNMFLTGIDLSSNDEVLKITNQTRGFIKLGNKFYVKNWLIPNKDLQYPLLNIYDFKSKKLIKQAFNLEEKYSWFMTGMSGGISYDANNGIFYVANNAPYEIFRIDTNLNVLPSFNMEQKIYQDS